MQSKNIMPFMDVGSELPLTTGNVDLAYEK
jgi:hypothetical protein